MILREWCYSGGIFNQVEIIYSESEKVDESISELGFTEAGNFGDEGGALSFKLYEHKDASNLGNDLSYRFLIMLWTLYSGYSIFFPHLPDLLEFLRLYAPSFHRLSLLERD